MSDISKNNNKYKTNNKINLYTENLIKFIIEQKDKIIPIGSIEKMDFIIGILFLTITNSFCKINKINVHAYYTAYSIINLFNKIKKKIQSQTILRNLTELTDSINYTDSNHFILGLSTNVDYLNSRVDPTNQVKNKINYNYSKLLIEIVPILNLLITSEQKTEKINSNEHFDILSKFFYLLLQTGKFIGSGSYKDPNLVRLSDYLSNIFNVLFKSKNITEMKINNTQKDCTEIYEVYLNYKNKLIYSLIELEINSETLDEIISYMDNEIITNLSIKIK